MTRSSPKRLSIAIWVLLGATLVGLSCTSPSDSSAPSSEGSEREELSEVGKQVLGVWATCAASGYGAFARETEALERALNELCAAPGEDRLESARVAFSSARRQWLGLRTFAIGPEITYPERYGPKIDFRPPRYESISEELGGDEELTTPAQTGAHLRGLPAIEYVLFGPPSDALEAEDRSCTYLTALGTDLHENARQLSAAWSADEGNFVAELLAEPGTSTFASPFEALSGVVGRMGYVVENLRDQDLRNPLGEEVGAVQLSLVVSLYSERSLEDFRDTLDGIEKLYFGAEEGLGLSTYAKDVGIDLDVEIRAAFDAAHANIDRLEPSFLVALDERPQDVRALSDALEELQLLFQINLIGRLGLLPVFNDADGD